VVSRVGGGWESRENNFGFEPLGGKREREMEELGTIAAKAASVNTLLNT